jgi:lysozyme family protein
MSRFANCLAITLRHEGSWSDHPLDKGGATMRGVTIARYAAYKGRVVTKDELRHISMVELEDIYRRGYWAKVAADDLPSGLDLTMFDFAVNSGPSRAVKTLQKIVGVTPDGSMGAFTVQAVRKFDPTSLIRQMYAARMSFLRNLSTWSTFGVGWKRRVDDILDRSLAMARGKAVNPPIQVEPTPKANPADQRTITKPNAKEKATATAGSVGAAVAEATQTLTPHSDSLEVIKWLCIALAVVSAGLLLWRAFKDKPS